MVNYDLRCMINCLGELYSQVYNNADCKMINDPRGESEQAPGQVNCQGPV